ncbi:hypothetical protein [Anabaena azotica]|uniref:hypothetical protein n=1 Tax=Anabaena azotica TaxID=197653 RepID=UPI0039A4F64C
MTTQSENKFPFCEILERCKKANIKTEVLQMIYQPWIQVNLQPEAQTKKDKINIFIKNVEEAEMLLDIDFETIYAISKYHGYYSIQDHYIEAMLEYAGSKGHSSIYTQVIKQLGILEASYNDPINQSSQIQETVNSDRIFISKNQYSDVKLSLGLSEKYFSILEGLSSWKINQTPESLQLKLTTIRIENVNISSHEDALAILEKIGNSLLFQLNIQTVLPIYLAPRENQDYSIIPSIIRKRNSSNEIQPVELNFPTHEYDTEPTSLYWYANTAPRMPILQYLAYYQVIEFYFPRFKNNDDTNEITSLKATIKNCVQPEDIKSFFEEESRLKFFRNYDKWKDITTKPSPIRKQSDIVNDTAIRIYDIRCKIVHTKNLDSSDEPKFILPFSKEAQKLGHDIELVQFIARKVLEHCRKPLTI